MEGFDASFSRGGEEPADQDPSGHDSAMGADQHQATDAEVGVSDPPFGFTGGLEAPNEALSEAPAMAWEHLGLGSTAQLGAPTLTV